jgi:hypothetical protein
VGDYFFGDQLKGVAVRMGEDKSSYFLEVLKSKDPLESATINYLEYFTVDGFFLEEKFKKLLDQFIDTLQKPVQK